MHGFNGRAVSSRTTGKKDTPHDLPVCRTNGSRHCRSCINCCLLIISVFEIHGHDWKTAVRRTIHSITSSVALSRVAFQQAWVTPLDPNAGEDNALAGRHRPAEFQRSTPFHVSFMNSKQAFGSMSRRFASRLRQRVQRGTRPWCTPWCAATDVARDQRCGGVKYTATSHLQRTNPTRWWFV